MTRFFVYAGCRTGRLLGVLQTDLQTSAAKSAFQGVGGGFLHF